MAILGVDDFKAKLRGGGARSNLFKATLNFPGYAGGDLEITSFMCKGAQLPGSVITPVPIMFRGRTLQICWRTRISALDCNNHQRYGLYCT